MCGIVGWHNRSRVEDATALLGRMMSSIIHRGPDDGGRLVSAPVALGIRRLSIIDVTGGHQPISNEDGTAWVVLNGEIYNYRQLRDELEAKGHIFKTKSDTEVIVHGYEEWGDDCVKHLNGIFGLAIWDERRRRMLLARDHYGVKPLYYYSDGTRVVFGSEIKAILGDDSIPREVNLEALDLYLSFRYVPSPHTMFLGIQKLAPGHRLIVDDNDVKVQRFYDNVPRCSEKRTESEWVAILQEQLEAAVARQMMSDVPIGALLSGGIDSGVIVAIMARHTDIPVQTFTVGFTGAGRDINELEEARRTADILGTTHRDILISSLDYQHLLQTAIWHLDEPIATTSALAMYSVCKLAREHVTVVLTGQGADEPMAAYYRHMAEKYGSIYRTVPRCLRGPILEPIAEWFPRSENLKRAVRSLGTEDPADRIAQLYAVFTEPMKASLWKSELQPNGNSARPGDIVRYWFSGTENLDPLIRMTYVDSRLPLSDDLLTYGDKMSMATSIEARVPLLDLEYMQIVESLPANLRIKGFTQKYIHKKVATKWLPPEIVNRPKRGFETPVDSWFRAELSGYVKQMLLSPTSACLQYFRADSVRSLFSDHLSGREDNRRQLFSLLVFELWHRQFISGRSKTPIVSEVTYA